MSSRAITLRLARAAEARSLAAMTRQYLEAGLPPRYPATRIARLIDHEDTIALVADDGSGLQGFAIIEFGDDEAHLVLLCVRPAWRRAGLGRRMVDWLVESARVAGIARIDLELRSDNQAAQDFYRALGFRDAAVVPGYYGGRLDALKMSRALRPRAG